MTNKLIEGIDDAVSNDDDSNVQNTEEISLLRNDINLMRETIAQHDKTIEEMRRLLAISNTRNDNISSFNLDSANSNSSFTGHSPSRTPIVNNTSNELSETALFRTQTIENENNTPNEDGQYDFNNTSLCRSQSDYTAAAIPNNMHLEDEHYDHSHASLYQSPAVYEPTSKKSIFSSIRSDQDRYIDDIEDFEVLSEDAYSFMILGDFTCKKNVPPIVIGWLVFFLQMAVYIIVFVSGLQINEMNGNLFGFPADVVTSTRIGQVFAILIAVLTQGDLRTALKMIVDGQQSLKFFVNHNSDDRNKTIIVERWKWWCAIYSRAVQGFAGLFVSFILVMQTSEVIELLLNFTALEFVSHLDDVVFRIAQEGFLGKRCKRITSLICSTGYYYDADSSRPSFAINRKATRAFAKIIRTIVLVLTLLAMFSAWAVIFVRQVTGRYSCMAIFVQFDDDTFFNLGTLSGTYQYERVNDRLMYKFVDIDGSTKNSIARFQFCSDDAFWAFSYNIKDPQSLDQEDICSNWIVRSTEDSFFMADIIAASWSTWFVRRENNEIMMDHMRLYCSECDNSHFCGSHGKCDKQANKCICEDGWYGIQCGFSEPCETIEIDTRRFDPNTSPYNSMWSTIYNRLDFVEKNIEEDDSYDYEINVNGNGNAQDAMLEIYSRPVYFSKHANSTRFDLIIFMGRRWVITTSLLMGWESLTTEMELINKLQNHFRGIRTNETFAFISAPVDFDTSTDAVTPVGVDFFIYVNNAYDDAGPTDVAFLCMDCDDNNNPCEAEGICGEDKRCTCVNGASGRLCEINPLGDGFCDIFFNFPRFNYDNGDCCQATCVSSTFKCGYNRNGSYAGYCNCKDPSYRCGNDQDTACWLPNSETIMGEIDFARSGAAVALNADGKILAVGEPGSETVRVFKNNGSKWEPFGQALRGEQNSRFGEAIAIGGEGNILVVGSPNFDIPDKVDPTRRTNNYQGRVSVFQADRNSWQTIYETPDDRPILPWITHGRLGSTLALTQSGRTIFVTFPFATNGKLDTEHELGLVSDGVILQLQWDMKNQSYFPSQLDHTDKNARHMGRSISVSKSGNTMVLGADADDLGQFHFVVAYRYGDDNAKSGRMLTQLGKRIKGCCGIVSGNGLMLAVSISGYDVPKCQVYFWYEDKTVRTGGDWIENGEVLDGSPLALSFDGMIVAVMSTVEYTIQTYSWEGNKWIHQGDVIQARDAAVAVLSGNNSTKTNTIMAVGMPVRNYGEQGSGKSTVFEFSDMEKAKESCGVENLALNSAVRVELTTDGKPNETIWEVRDYFKKTTLLRGGPYNIYDNKFSVIIDEAILSTNVTCAEFRIFDLGGDGICCDKGLGSYALFYGGRIEKVGGLFQWTESHLFGNCACEKDESLFGLELAVDSFGDETVWTLTDEDKNVISEGGPFRRNDAGVTHIESRCIPSDKCVEFNIYDTNGDGICCEYGYGKYSVSWDGTIYGTGGEFATNETIALGGCQSSNISDVPGGRISQICNANGTANLHVSVTVGSSRSGTKWILVKEGETVLKGGPYNEQIMAYEDLCVDLNLCYYFEIVDSANKGNSKSGRYSLSLDGEEIESHESSPGGNHHWIGKCAHIARPVSVPGATVIACNGGLQNYCVSPGECAVGGISLEPAGNGLLFDLDFRNARWTTSGDFSLVFGVGCDVVCFGCYASPVLKSSCTDNEVAYDVWFYNSNLNQTVWSLESRQWRSFHEGGPYLDTLDSASRVIGKMGSKRTWTFEQRCLARDVAADPCTILFSFRKQITDKRYGVYLYMHAELFFHIEFDTDGIASLSSADNGKRSVTFEETNRDVTLRLGNCAQ